MVVATAAAIAAGVGVASRLFSGHQNRKAQSHANRKNAELQKEFAQYGIRWKVADAKAAGLHPLYALGGSTPTFSPSFKALGHSDVSRAGQDINRAIQAHATPVERQVQTMQLKHLEAQTEKEHALALYYSSQSARAAQSGNTSKSLPLATDISGKEPAAGFQNQYDTAQFQPSPVISAKKSNKSQTAGVKPLWDTYKINSKGDTIKLPSADNPSETLESGGAVVLALMHPHNKALMSKYGKKAVKEYIEKTWNNVKYWAGRVYYTR